MEEYREYFSKQLARYLEKKEMTYSDLANRLGVNKSVVASWKSGARYPRMNTMQRVAEILGCEISDLIQIKNDANPVVAPQRRRTVKIPVLGSIVAGAPETAFSDVIDWFEIPEELAKHGDYFVLKVHGDSMSPEICDGDHVVIRHQETAESGDICVVCINGDECTVKEIQRSTEGIMLVGYNRDVYTPTFYGNEEIERLPLRIEGIVVQCIRKYKEF